MGEGSTLAFAKRMDGGAQRDSFPPPFSRSLWEKWHIGGAFGLLYGLMIIDLDHYQTETSDSHRQERPFVYSTHLFNAGNL